MIIDKGPKSPRPASRRDVQYACALLAALFLTTDWTHAQKPRKPTFGAARTAPATQSAKSISIGAADVMGRVASLRVQSLGNPVLYFTLDNSVACNGTAEAYFFARSDVDFDYASKSLLAARLGGREIKLSGVSGCPSAATLIEAGSVRIVESTPRDGPPTDAAAGLSGRVTNLKIQDGIVFFRIDACSGGDPYFKFATSALPGGLRILLAAQASKRRVRVFTTTSGGGTCPSSSSGQVELGSGGGLWLL